MRFSRVLAVDCGASHVAVGLFSRNAASRLTLQRFATEALPPGSSGDAEWAADIGAALGAIRRRENLRGACVLGVPGHLTLSKVVRIPAVSGRRQKQIIRFEVRQSLPWEPEELVWNHVVVSTGGEGSEIVITAGRLAAVTALCDQVRRAGFYPRAAVPSWLVLREGMRHFPVVPGAALILGIGARASHLVHDGPAQFFIRAMALGGDMVTQGIADELDGDLARAEALKRRVSGDAAPAPDDGPESMAVQIAADQFIRRLGGEISRSLAVVGPADHGNRPAVLYLTGGGSLLAALPRELTKILQRPVELWDFRTGTNPGNAIGCPAGKLEAAHRNDIFGLAACATGREAAPASLVPRSVRREMLVRRWWPGMLAASTVVAAGLLFLIWRFQIVARETRWRASALERKIGSVQRFEARNRANLARLAETNRRIVALQRLTEGRSSWVMFLADLQDRLVEIEDVWLERLQILPAAAGGPAPGPLRLSLAGWLLDSDNPLARPGEVSYQRAKALVASLGRSPFVAAVEGERFDASHSGALRFELTLVLVPHKLF